MERKNLLLTGASGFVGRRLLHRLKSHGQFLVVAASRAPRGSCHQSVIDILIDGIDAATKWHQDLKNVEVVVHLAARAHILKEKSADPLGDFRQVNLEGTLNLALQAAKSGVKRFVFISSVGVNGSQTQIGHSFSEVDQPNPHNAYAISKLEAEQGLLRISNESGLEVVIIRPPLVYGLNAPGNFGSLLRAVHRGWPLPLGAVHNQRSLVALDNLVDFIITCINHPQAANQTFLVSDGQDLSTSELVRCMAQVAGLSAHLLPVPVWALKAGASLLGRGDVVQRLCGNLQIDISKARSLLGWVPPVSVEEGLRRAMAV